MFFVTFFDLIELLFTGFILCQSELVEKIAVGLVFVDDVEGHLEIGVLELDDEVHKNLVFHLGDRKVLPALPELLCHPVSNNSHILQVFDVLFDVVNLLSK